MSYTDVRSDFIALEQFVALAAKYPQCLDFPERLRDVLADENYAEDALWRRDLLVALCQRGFATQLRLRRDPIAEQCFRACKDLVRELGCILNQARWTVMAWRVAVAAGSAEKSPEPERDDSSMLASSVAPSASHSGWAKCQVGDVFTFGNYPQGANGEVLPIEWQVLRRDKDGLLVISKYALDCKPYNEEFCDITWSECALRKWLNSEFIYEAFDEKERQQIKEVHLNNPNSKFDDSVPGGPDTDDKVFLLSHDEAECLFNDDDSRMCKPTAYAVENNAYTDDYDGMCVWWLRSPGDYANYAAGVNFGGDVDYECVCSDSLSVRPACKIAL